MTRKAFVLATAMTIVVSGLTSAAPASARTVHHRSDFFGRSISRDFMHFRGSYNSADPVQSPATESNGSQALREFRHLRSPTDD